MSRSGTLGLGSFKAAGLLILAIGLFLVLLRTSEADNGPISVLSTEIITEFPEGIRFKMQAEGENEIVTTAVKLRSVAQASEALAYLEHEGGTLVDGKLFWRTNTAERYIPPGSLFEVRFEVEDSEGTIYETEPQEFVYNDARFTWQEVSEGPITVAYHGPVKVRAENMLRTIIETIQFMGPVLGADIETPIRVTMYNNNLEMLGALPPRSAALGRELITEGRAFSDYGVVLVLGSGRLALGTAGHEVMHILVSRAGAGRLGPVPSWLNEGLAEFGNPEPGFSYDIALDFAIETDQLLPVVYMQTLPGDSEQAIIFYGQARSLISYMIFRYGADRMRQLMAELKGGTRMDTALEQIYGLDREGMDNEWREAIGAPEYVPPDTTSRPTPIPLPTIQMFSLTPQPVVSDDDEPEVVEASESEQDEVSGESEAVADAGVTDEPTAESEAAAAGESDPQEEPAGGGCNGPANGATGMMDLSAVALAMGLAVLALRRRILRR